MHVVDAIKARRAVKHYDPAHQLSSEQEQLLLESALLSPTAFNIQNWRFVVVKDQALRQDIRQAAWGQAQVTDASLLIVLCADLHSWEKEPVRYWAGAPAEVQSFMLPAIDGYYRDKAQVMRDEAMRSCGLVGQTLMLTAKAMGLDSCPMDGFDYEAVGRLINLPKDHVVSMMVAVGKGIKDPWPRPGQLTLDDIVINDKW